MLKIRSDFKIVEKGETYNYQLRCLMVYRKTSHRWLWEKTNKDNKKKELNV